MIAVICLAVFLSWVFYKVYKMNQRHKATMLEAKEAFEKFQAQLEDFKREQGLLSQLGKLSMQYNACTDPVKLSTLSAEILTTLEALAAGRANLIIKVKGTNNEITEVPIRDYITKFKTVNAAITPRQNRFTIIEGGKNEYLQ